MARVYAGTPFNLAQLGQEVTPGTAVAATTIMRAVYEGFEDQRTTETIPETIGRLFQAERTRITNEGITIPLPSTPLTYEQFPHLVNASIEKMTPTGAGPYVYTGAFPTDTTVNDIQYYTMEIGNVRVLEDAKKIPYCWVESFEISGEAKGLWMMSATWQGQQDVTLGSFSAATLPSPITEAVFGNTLFYIDDSGGTIGTTSFTGLLMSATITVTSGLVWVPTGDGNLYPTATKGSTPEVTFSFEYELEDGDAGSSLVAQERAAYKANSLRLFRLNVPGPGNMDLTIDMAAKYDSPGPYTDNDGNQTVTFEGHAVLSDTNSLAFSVETTNDSAALP